MDEGASKSNFAGNLIFELYHKEFEVWGVKGSDFKNSKDTKAQMPLRAGEENNDKTEESCYIVSSKSSKIS